MFAPLSIQTVKGNEQDDCSIPPSNDDGFYNRAPCRAVYRLVHLRPFSPHERLSFCAFCYSGRPLLISVFSYFRNHDVQIVTCVKVSLVICMHQQVVTKSNAVGYLA